MSTTSARSPVPVVSISMISTSSLSSRRAHSFAMSCCRRFRCKQRTVTVSARGVERFRACLLESVTRRQSESYFLRSHLGIRLPVALTNLRRFTRLISSSCTMLE